MKDIIDFKYLDKGKDELNNMRHSHGESYELLLVRAGSGNVVVREQIFELKSGCVYFINGMETHCTNPDNPDEYYRGKIIVSAQFIDKITDAMGCRGLIDEIFHKNGGKCFVPNDEEAEYIDCEFSAINRAIEKEDEYSSMAVAASMINIMCSCQKTKESKVTDDKQMKEILEYISRNLSHKITLKDICEYSHISKYYLCHTFKERVGMTIFEYILSRRLSLAKKYLLKTDMSISEIANATGFSTFAYFSKVFREMEECTPKEFRMSNIL